MSETSIPVDAPIVRFEGGTLCAPLDFPYPLQTAALWKKDEGRSGQQRCYAMHYWSLCQSGEPFLDQVADWFEADFSTQELHSLRDYQQEAKDAWMGRKEGIVVMPTGAGKTEVALSIIGELRCSVLVICPYRALMYQWKERLANAFQCAVGMVGDAHFHLRAITVTTYKSACIHMETIGNRFQFLIFDECHHLPGRMRGDAARMSIAPWRLGLTATPPSGDRGTECESLIGPVAFRLPLDRMPKSALAQFSVQRIAVELTDTERKEYDRLGKVIQRFIADQLKKNQDFRWQDAFAENCADLAARQAVRAKRLRDNLVDCAAEKLAVLEELLMLHADAQMIVFTGTNPMAFEISRRFLIPCLLNHCNGKERSFILDGFREGRFQAIVANQVLDEGIDVPSAKVAVVLGGKGDQRQAVQRLGRIMRRRGDARAILYEVVCNQTGEVEVSRKRRKNDAYQRRSDLGL